MSLRFGFFLFRDAGILGAVQPGFIVDFFWDVAVGRFDGEVFGCWFGAAAGCAGVEGDFCEMCEFLKL